MLLFGPPGLGKTTLAQIVARELGVGFRATSGPVIQRAGDLAALLTNLAAARRAVHRRDPPPVAGGRGDPLSGDGGFPARPDHRRGAGRALGAHRPAALHPGRRDDPLGPHHPAAARALRHSAAARCSTSRPSCADRRARRPGARLRAAARRRGRDRAARPRHAARRDAAAAPGARLRRGRGLATVDAAAADAALLRLEVDGRGLDAMDRRYLRCIAENYGGGPVGVETLAAALGDQRDVIEEVIEPYLIQQGFVQRTPRGRMLTRLAFRHLGLPVPAALPAQLDLLARLPLAGEAEEVP